MRVHLITIGTKIEYDLDVAAMLREDRHVLVATAEEADLVAVWNPSCKPIYVVSGESGPQPTTCYSLHALRGFIRETVVKRRPVAGPFDTKAR